MWAVYLVIILAWLWFVRVYVMPKFYASPTIETKADDPRMLAAIEQARSTIPRLKELWLARADDTFVRVPFLFQHTGLLRSKEQTEPLWGRVLAWKDDALEVELQDQDWKTRGRVERKQRFQLDAVQDWQVKMADESIHGGYTMGVMFEAALEKIGSLSPELAKHAAQYVDLPNHDKLKAYAEADQ